MCTRKKKKKSERSRLNACSAAGYLFRISNPCVFCVWFKHFAADFYSKIPVLRHTHTLFLQLLILCERIGHSTGHSRRPSWASPTQECRSVVVELINHANLLPFRSSPSSCCCSALRPSSSRSRPATGRLENRARSALPFTRACGRDVSRWASPGSKLQIARIGVFSSSILSTLSKQCRYQALWEDVKESVQNLDTDEAGQTFKNADLHGE